MRQAMERRPKVVRVSVPSVEAVKAAFVADAIDAEQLDVLMGAAVAGRAVEVPRVVERAASRSPLTDRPGQVLPYSPVKGRYKAPRGVIVPRTQREYMRRLLDE